MKNIWTGVRPVRFREEIFGAIELIAGKKGVSIEELTNFLLNLRLKRENRRLLATQRYVTLENKRRKREEKLLTKVEQMIRVLRRTGLVVKENQKIYATAQSRKLISIKKNDEVRADAFFIELLLNSPFHTYWLFLKRLSEKKKILIPSSLSKRDEKLREYITSQGFPLDVWSFFIIRDLFHDFSLINYTMDASWQTIFPLYGIYVDKPKQNPYKYKVDGPDATLWFWSKMSTDFVGKFVKTYLSMTDNRLNRIAKYITLREKFSLQYSVPERQFDILLQKTLQQKSKFRIVLSVGHIYFTKKSTYATKALSLPYNKSGLPYSLVRIEVSDSNERVV